MTQRPGRAEPRSSGTGRTPSESRSCYWRPGVLGRGWVGGRSEGEKDEAALPGIIFIESPVGGAQAGQGMASRTY